MDVLLSCPVLANAQRRKRFLLIVIGGIAPFYLAHRSIQALTHYWTSIAILEVPTGLFLISLLASLRSEKMQRAVTIAAGQQPRLTLNPFRGMETMTAYIVNISLGDTEAGSMEYKSLYAVALSLFVITLSMNVLAQWVLKRFREVYE